VQTHQPREGDLIACASGHRQRAFLIWNTHRSG
jgi:hypothetical protein